MSKHRATSARGSLVFGFKGHLPAGGMGEPDSPGSLFRSVCSGWAPGDVEQSATVLPRGGGDPGGAGPWVPHTGMAVPRDPQRLARMSKKQNGPRLDIANS